ncbi:MAG: hypothetical protein A2328_02895, partial [Bdellovibrionales bacterium RIFOXYB2_FULL_36_6]
MTKQRQIILNILRSLHSHPTADDLYMLARKEMPNISLGTVYRNLNLLAEKGDIIAIQHAGQRKRFDGNHNPHYHFKCLSCGGVYDLPIDRDLQLSSIAPRGSEHHIEG